MPFVSGFLRVRRGGHPDNSLPGGEGPVDPDYGIEEGRPDNSLPMPPGPVDPGFGVPLPPVRPDQGLPGSPGHPSHPIVRPPPTYPVDPGYGLPIPPTVWPQPPRPVGPDNSLPPIPVSPSHPIYLPSPGAPNNDLPLQPGQVWPPLPPSITGQVMAFVWIVGVGYRWTTIDADLKPTHPMIPPSTVPEAPDNTLPSPPTAEPRR